MSNSSIRLALSKLTPDSAIPVLSTLCPRVGVVVYNLDILFGTIDYDALSREFDEYVQDVLVEALSHGAVSGERADPHCLSVSVIEDGREKQITLRAAFLTKGGIRHVRRRLDALLAAHKADQLLRCKLQLVIHDWC